MALASASSSFPPVFSIGHSNHNPEAFVALLKQHNINRVIDVRSSPASHRFPQYNSDNLKQLVEASGIEYIHRKILGGREKGGDIAFRIVSDPAVCQTLLKDLKREDLLPSGNREEENIITKNNNTSNKNFLVAMMCSEGCWKDCHRQNIIHYLVNQLNVRCMHIWPDGKLEEHQKGVSKVRMTQKDEETAKLIEEMELKKKQKDQQVNNDDDDDGNMDQSKGSSSTPESGSTGSKAAQAKPKKRRLQ